MGLQINPPVRTELPNGVVEESGGDDWGTRIAKLIPAEALGLYGTAAAMVPKDQPSTVPALFAVVAVACVLLVLIRHRSARDPDTGAVQWKAILISLVSFLIWLGALGTPTSPYGWPADLQFAGPLVAFLWGTMVPYFYNGRNP